MSKSEIIIYQAYELSSRIDVKVESETVWLNRNQLAILFNRDVKTIGKHINNVFSEGELDKDSTVANFATVQNEGGRSIERIVQYYNLDVIISVGYRVKSKQGTQFRIWANGILKDYLLKGYSINNRFNRIEDDIYSLKEKVDKIDLKITAEQLPSQGIFFEGQIFDAYKFVSDLFRSAEKSIVIIDNYVDDSVLVHLTKVKKSVKVKIMTKIISDQFRLDLKKFGEQYFDIEVSTIKSIHDRFIIIDGQIVYHFGASLKELGKKLFGFTKMDKAGMELIEKFIKS